MGAEKRLAEEDVIREYVEKTASIAAACRALGVCRATLKKAMKRYGIAVIPERQFGHRMTDFPRLRDREWLAEQLRTRTMLSIATELGTSSGNVSDHVRRHGLRWKHYDRIEAVKEGLRKAGKRVGERASNWRGGRVRTGGGHIYVHRPEHPHANHSGYVMEHRFVAEQMIGRHLGFNEVVHHKNGVKTDNRPENLEVMTVSEHRKEHMDAHKKLHEARERIAQLEAYIRTHGLAPPA